MRLAVYIGVILAVIGCYEPETCESLCQSGQCSQYAGESTTDTNAQQACITSCNAEISDSDIDASLAGYCEADVEHAISCNPQDACSGGDGCQFNRSDAIYSCYESVDTVLRGLLLLGVPDAEEYIAYVPSEDDPDFVPEKQSKRDCALNSLDEACH